MAFRHGKTAEVTVNGTALSSYCDSADLSIDVDTADTTTFGDSWKTALAGLIGGKFSLKGDYDPTASTGPGAVLTAAINGGTAVPVVYYPGGSVSGQVSRSFNAIVTSYDESSPVGDKVTFSSDLMLSGSATFGTV